MFPPSIATDCIVAAAENDQIFRKMNGHVHVSVRVRGHITLSALARVCQPGCQDDEDVPELVRKELPLLT